MLVTVQVKRQIQRNQYNQLQYSIPKSKQKPIVLKTRQPSPTGDPSINYKKSTLQKTGTKLVELMKIDILQKKKSFFHLI